MNEKGEKWSYYQEKNGKFWVRLDGENVWEAVDEVDAKSISMNFNLIEARVAKYRKALEFYADESHWPTYAMDDDKGATAQAALKEDE